jgi:hypothetical protein
MMPPEPSLMLDVRAPMCAISTLVSDDAMDGMLWCSVYQTRWYALFRSLREREALARGLAADDGRQVQD